jgi:hypothetical protein
MWRKRWRICRNFRLQSAERRRTSLLPYVRDPALREVPASRDSVLRQRFLHQEEYGTYMERRHVARERYDAMQMNTLSDWWST